MKNPFQPYKEFWNWKVECWKLGIGKDSGMLELESQAASTGGVRRLESWRRIFRF